MSEAAQSMDRVGRLSPATTTGVLVAGVIICFVLFVVVFFLYLRSNRYWGAIPVSGGGSTRLASAATEPRGLDAAAVAALPPHVVVRAGGLKEGLECPVCLSVLSEGEAARLLPQCGHAFHLECIDMWFCSHSTCPVCRSPAVLVEPENTDSCAELAPGNAQSAEFLPNTPANVLLRASESQASNEESGSQEESSSSASGSPPGVLVIEIPRRAVDGLQTPNSPLPASRLPEEAMSPPTTTTLRSFRRLLILGSRIAGASRNPRGRDVEQGRAPASKAPTSS